MNDTTPVPEPESFRTFPLQPGDLTAFLIHEARASRSTVRKLAKQAHAASELYLSGGLRVFRVRGRWYGTHYTPRRAK